MSALALFNFKLYFLGEDTNTLGHVWKFVKTEY